MRRASKSGMQTSNAAPEQRCLFFRYFDADEPNPAAEERALEMRYGPEVALVGRCQHEKSPQCDRHGRLDAPAVVGDQARRRSRASV